MVGSRDSTDFNSVDSSRCFVILHLTDGLDFLDWLQLSVYVHVLSGFGCWACVFRFRTIEDTGNAIAISLD